MANSIEIRVLATGPTPETAALTLAVTFTFSQSAVDRFKALIPWHDRAWSADEKVWYAKREYLDAIKAFAQTFDGAMLIEGNRWLNLRTGQSYEQQTLFE